MTGLTRAIPTLSLGIGLSTLVLFLNPLHGGAPVPATGELAPGAIVDLYQIAESLTSIPRIDPDVLPNVSRAVETIDWSDSNGGFLPVTERFFCRVRGVLRIPRNGEYHFRLISDDGSRLLIGEELVVDHNGAHAATPKDGTVALRKGDHPFSMEHFDSGGAHSLRLEWRPPGQKEFALAPAPLFRHDPDAILETTEGIKPLAPEISPTEGLKREIAVARAIDVATDWLLSEAEGLQVFEEVNVKEKSAQVAFETYALIIGGVPVDHPQIVANLKLCKDQVSKQKYTYGVCSEIMAHDAAIAQLEEDQLLAKGGKNPARIIGNRSIGKSHRRRIASLAEILLSSQNAEGGWHYYPQETSADISCTQFVVLALAVAERRGVKVPVKTWRQVAKYTLSLQEKSGPKTEKRIRLLPKEQRGGSVGKKKKDKGRGATEVADPRDRALTGGEGIDVHCREFEYSPGHPVAIAGNRWNRVCAGTNSLMVVRERVGARIPPRELASIEAGIRDGLGWMLENWSPFDSFYGIYSLEKVGDLGHIESFEGVDWYDNAAQWLLDSQRTDGSWGSTSMWGESPRITTSFAILVLRRASAILNTTSVDRIITTGGGGDTVPGADLEWVYLPELDTSLHWPELVRILKRRPRRSSIEILESVVEAMEPVRRGGLVPALVQIWERARDKKAKRSVGELIETVIGREPESTGDVVRWHRLWREAEELSAQKDVPTWEALSAIYREQPPSAPLRAVVIRAAVRHGVREIVPQLIDDLDAKTTPLRAEAYQGLRGFFGATIPAFEAGAAAAKRRPMVEAIRAFVDEKSG